METIEYRFLLASGSMSEPSLVSVAGLLLSKFFTDLTIQWIFKVWKFSLHFNCPGQLGIDRDSIKVYFKNPSRQNVFLQTRHVDEISTE